MNSTKLKFLFLFFIAQFSFSIDYIHDDFKEAEGFKFHSLGFMTYGFHSNTFHLRNFFGRVNYQLSDVQFFISFNGYADTHDPAINYGYIVNNINLYDYGIWWKVWNGFFISPRAQATYRPNLDTFLLLTPYYFGALSEFDATSVYQAMQKTGPGLRVGYSNEKFEIGYSQGDFRHSIPSAFLGTYRCDQGYVRAVLYSEYQNPANFDRSTLRYKGQLSALYKYVLNQYWTLGAMAEGTVHQDGYYWIRFEQLVQFQKFILGIRELISNTATSIVEGSLLYDVQLAQLGFQLSTNGNFYMGAKVNF
jgi:hypothetical protein